MRARRLTLSVYVLCAARPLVCGGQHLVISRLHSVQIESQKVELHVWTEFKSTGTWLQLCVRTWVSCSCFACLLDGLKYVNILSVLEGMTYQNFGKSSMQRTHQDCCRYYVNVLDGS